MTSVTDIISVSSQSSIRIAAEQIIYADPYKTAEYPFVPPAAANGDIILITHRHSDHYSTKDIAKLMKADAYLIVPGDLKEKASADFPGSQVITLSPGENICIGDILIEAVPAYNVNKNYHPKENEWLGYVLTIHGSRIYIAGDTDINEDNRRIRCDIAMVPVGGTYTMTADEAALLVNEIRPACAIPTHYGSVVGSRSDGDAFAKAVAPDIEVITKIQF